MKTLLLSFLLVFASLHSSAQVWAPAGATWHYEWVQMWVSGYVKIQYVGDSMVGDKLCKVLKKELYTYDWLNQTYSSSVSGYEYTYLENNIVYYHRYGQFYTLYDFSAIPGTSWTVAGWQQNTPCDSTGSIVVDSTGMTTINSFSLKYLQTSPGSGSDWEFPNKVVERIGSLGWMFPEPNCVVDITEGGPLRCYYDDEFGLFQRPGYPPTCDYITGTDKDKGLNNGIRIYPVPATSSVTVELNDQARGEVRVDVSDILGNRIQTIITNEKRLSIRIDELREGIYFITITDQAGLFYNQTIIKQTR